MCLGKPFYLFWPFQNSLKIVRKMSRMVWLCEFWSGINGWDLKILYKDLKSKKKIEKKNRMERNNLED